MPEKSLGQVIAEARKNKRWSLRELSDKVKKEDGSTVSPQYLNDIEHDKRTPSVSVIDNLAKELSLDRDYLGILAGSQPEGMKKYPELAGQVAKAFRRGDVKAIRKFLQK